MPITISGGADSDLVVPLVREQPSVTLSTSSGGFVTITPAQSEAFYYARITPSVALTAIGGATQGRDFAIGAAAATQFLAAVRKARSAQIQAQAAIDAVGVQRLSRTINFAISSDLFPEGTSVQGAQIEARDVEFTSTALLDAVGGQRVSQQIEFSPSAALDVIGGERVSRQISFSSSAEFSPIGTTVQGTQVEIRNVYLASTAAFSAVGAVRALRDIEIAASTELSPVGGRTEVRNIEASSAATVEPVGSQVEARSIDPATAATLEPVGSQVEARSIDPATAATLEPVGSQVEARSIDPATAATLEPVGSQVEARNAFITANAATEAISSVITVTSGGVQPVAQPLEDGDDATDGLPAGLVDLANFETSASGESIESVVVSVSVDGGASEVIDTTTTPHLTAFSIDPTTSPNTLTLTIDKDETTQGWESVTYQVTSTGTSYGSISAMDAGVGSAVATGTLTTNPANLDLSGIADGDYRLWAYAVGVGGKQTEPPFDLLITVDNTAPVISITGETGVNSGIEFDVNTDSSQGTIYAAARLAVNPVLTESEIVNKTGNAVETTSLGSPDDAAANAMSITGLAADDYVVDVVQRDGFSNSSTIVSSGTVTVSSYTQKIYASPQDATADVNSNILTGENPSSALLSDKFTLSYWQASTDGISELAFTYKRFGARVYIKLNGTFGIDQIGSYSEFTTNAVPISTTSGNLIHYYVFLNTTTQEVRVFIDGIDFSSDFPDLPSGLGDMNADGYFFDVTRCRNIEFADFMLIPDDVPHADLYNGGTPPDPDSISATKLILLGGSMTAAQINNGENAGTAVITLHPTNLREI